MNSSRRESKAEACSFAHNGIYLWYFGTALFSGGGHVLEECSGTAEICRFPNPSNVRRTRADQTARALPAYHRAAVYRYRRLRPVP